MTALGLGLGRALNPLTLGPSFSTTFLPQAYASVIETLGTTQVVVVSLPASITEGLGLSPRCEEIYRQLVEVVEGLGLAPTLATLNGIILTETMGLAHDVTPNQRVQLTITETLQLIEVLLPGLPVTVTETLALSVTETVQQAITVIEGLGLGPVLLPEARYNVSIIQALRFADSLANFFGGEIVEGLGFAPSLAGGMLLDQTLTESLALADAQVANLVMRVEIEEGLGLDDVQLLNAIYTGAIVEGLGLSLAYISPGGGITTWAMNTRTAAVTEYDNYEFSSFAKLGDTYIGASSSGLYELIGDDDDGTDIVARIKSGFAQWAGSRLTILKGAYLGIRGEGNFVLKVITGDDKTYIYTVNAQSMMTTKVTTGKGIKSRYLRFELISTGQDFDLESIEFMPLVAQRRV